MLKNILYVHGYKSSSKSNTVKNLRMLYPTDNVFSDDFDLMNVDETLHKITKLINKFKIDYLVGSSLGGFYTLLYNEIAIKKIVINPCMIPSVEIPKIDSDVPKSVLPHFIARENFVNSNRDDKTRQNVFGIFGLEDELFHYGSTFKQFYGNVDKSNQIYIHGQHRLNIDQLTPAIAEAFNYYAEKK